MGEERPTPALRADQLFDVLEHIYNQVYVLDGDGRIIYVNGGFARNYGIRPQDIIGHHHNEFLGQLWFSTAIPEVFEKKQRLSYERTTYLGGTERSIATPVLGPGGAVEMVVCITEEQFDCLDIQYGAEEPDPATPLTFTADMTDALFAFSSPPMRVLMQTAQQYAQSETTVLIEGESGTGKSMLAQFIHHNSPRRAGPFLTLNCAAIAEGLLESELFGYAPYAFTGASPKGKRGLVELADRGTLFLDEIGEMPLALQAKLLDFVETGRFIPVGGKEPRHVDIRVVAATNRDLAAMVAEGHFREDLYWRINVLGFWMPRLQERREDILLLANWFLRQLGAEDKRLSQEAVNALLTYDWPGNIRQLRNVMERCVIFASGMVIEKADLPAEIAGEAEGDLTTAGGYEAFLSECEQKIVAKAFGQTPSSRGVAKSLGISQSTASRLLRKYGISEDTAGGPAPL